MTCAWVTSNVVSRATAPSASRHCFRPTAGVGGLMKFSSEGSRRLPSISSVATPTCASDTARFADVKEQPTPFVAAHIARPRRPS